MMKFTPAHENFNVTDLDASIQFYTQALGLHEKRRHESENFTIVFMSCDSGFELELTWLKDHPQKYDLGEGEFHLAFTVDAADFAAAKAMHESMDCVCFDNAAMGLYFIEDPDGYWIEILPAK